jgi:hypothetical protein
MRTISIFVYTLLSAAQALAAPCEVFEHKNFSGELVAIERNQSLARLGALKDRVSSIKVDPQCLIVAFAEEEYRGSMITFGPGEHPTLPEGWDDQISSLHCNCR